MVYSLQGDLAYATEAARDQVLAQIQQAVEGRARWGVDLLKAETIPDFRWEGPPQPGHVPCVRFGLRFTTRQSRDQVVQAIENLATGQRLPLDSSWFQIHDCRDDEGDGIHAICPTPDRFKWQNGVLVDV